MHTRERWQNWCWSAGLAVVLVGCAPGEAPNVSNGAEPPAAPQAVTPAVVEPAAAMDTAAEQAAKPAMLAEIRQVIDWFTLPKPDGAGWERTYLSQTRHLEIGRAHV